jgi:hypothetical protein
MYTITSWIHPTPNSVCVWSDCWYRSQIDAKVVLEFNAGTDSQNVEQSSPSLQLIDRQLRLSAVTSTIPINCTGGWTTRGTSAILCFKSTGDHKHNNSHMMFGAKPELISHSCICAVYWKSRHNKRVSFLEFYTSTEVPKLCGAPAEGAVGPPGRREFFVWGTC